ncbi:hypothetical protein CDEST_13878 [Colletotrichum destructivum]|uniref:Uncharacterized protein n=1 Tax=Colletotrichum destructivum TaxID=34406 RepID=A0AAX4J064_9PEZI|nr:hypothetical protein CDEST_13878 [Colletotrichum destructivum]
MPHGGAVQNKPWNAGTKPNNGTGNSVLTASIESIPFPSDPPVISTFKGGLMMANMFPYAFARRPAPPTLPWAAAKLKRKCPMTLKDRPRLELEKKRIRNLEMTRTPARQAGLKRRRLAAIRLWGPCCIRIHRTVHTEETPSFPIPPQIVLRHLIWGSIMSPSFPDKRPLPPPSEIHSLHTKEGGELSAGTDIFASSKQTQRSGVKVSTL